MLTNPEPAPSAWVIRFVPLIRPGGLVLDLAAGGGRHTRLLCRQGYRVRAVDRDAAALRALDCEAVELDLETGAPWSLGGGYDGIVVTNYLHRPLLPAIAAAVAPGGAVIYETFMRGQETFGRPSNPDFLLRPGELLDAFKALSVVAFEQGETRVPRRAMVQRLAAVNLSPALLPAGAAVPPPVSASPAG
jgi:SAM-dependent methyltransferase